MSLTHKQEAFVHEYLVDCNAAAAARRAGYSAKTARKIGQENLTKLDISTAIDAEIQRRAQRTRVTADRVLLELARIGLADMCDFATWDDHGVRLTASRRLSTDDSAAVTKVKFTPGQAGNTIEIKLGHKDSALRMLAQHTGLFDQNRHATAALAETFLAGADAMRDIKVRDLSE